MQVQQFPIKVCVTSISFCKDQRLVQRLREHFPTCELNSHGRVLAGADLANFIGDAEALIVGNEIIDRNLLVQTPKLRIISKYGVGIDNVSVADLEEFGVTFAWTAGVNRRAVAELTLGLMLGTSRNLFRSAMELKAGHWFKSGGREVTEKTVGIIGCGHVGIEMLLLLQPFGCRLLVNDIVDKSLICAAYRASQVSLDELVREADFVSLHVPLTPQTKHFVDQNFLRKMKQTAILINTSRGAVINEPDLAAALRNHQIRAAATDVFATEPQASPELTSLENFWGTAHIGGNSSEAVLAMGNAALDGILRWCKG